MIVRLKHVKRVRAKGRTYWYHRITGERLPDDREERAARAMEINRTMKGTARKIAPGSLADVISQYKRAPEYRRLRDQTRHEYAIYLDLLSGVSGLQFCDCGWQPWLLRLPRLGLEGVLRRAWFRRSSRRHPV